MPLITKILNAFEAGELERTFTCSDLKKWILKNDVRKDDGSLYADSSINAILSNSDLKNKPTSNLNAKMLHSKALNKSTNYYWFE